MPREGTSWRLGNSQKRNLPTKKAHQASYHSDSSADNLAGTTRTKHRWVNDELDTLDQDWLVMHNSCPLFKPQPHVRIWKMNLWGCHWTPLFFFTYFSFQCGHREYSSFPCSCLLNWWTGVGWPSPFAEAASSTQTRPAGWTSHTWIKRM